MASKRNQKINYQLLYLAVLGGIILLVIPSTSGITDCVITYSKSKIIYQPQEEAFGKYKEIKRRFANTKKAQKLINYKVNYKTLNVIKNIIDKWKK